MNSDSAVPGLNRNNAHARTIHVPPLPEQKAIAEILGALDDKIDLNRRMCKTLESMAQALFKSWFVDFDPVHAKMRGEQPYGMDAQTAALFPDRFVESELGLIPEGWKIRSLDQIADFLNGLALQKYPAKGVDFLPIIKIAQIRQESCTNSDKASAEIPAEYIIDDRDIIFSWSGSLMQVLWTGGKGALNQHLFKVTSNTYPKWFYYLWIQHHMPWFQLVAESKATTMGHIQRKHLEQAKVLVPPFILEKENKLLFSKIFSKLTQLKIEIKKLERTRDYLLPKLIAGEVRTKL
jgi:type I restriction enzyme S subunit